MATATQIKKDMRFKIVLIGDTGVGKSTFIKRHLTGEFTTKHIPTFGVDVYPLVFYTNYGSIVFEVWDTAGQERYGGLTDGYALEAKAIIGVFDLTSNNSLVNLNLLLKKYPHRLPSVVCGNKYDIKAQQVTNDQKLGLLEDWDTYSDISTKSKYNFVKPFIYLARVLTGHYDLEFVEGPHR